MTADRPDGPTSGWAQALTFSPLNLAAALVIAFLVAALGAVAVLGQAEKYSSTATVAVDQPLLIATGGDRVIDKLARLRAKYAPLLRTDTMTVPLAQELGVTTQEVRDALRPSTPADSLLIQVRAVTDSREDSERYARAAAAFLVEYVEQEQVEDEVPAEARFEMVVVDDARRATRTSPDQRRGFAVAAVAGLIGGAVAYVVLQLVRPRPRRR